MEEMNRRAFLKHGAAVGVAAGALGFSVSAAGANDRVVIGLMGCGGRGCYLADLFAKRSDVEIRQVADPDLRRAEKCAKNIESVTGTRPEVLQDFRRMLDNPEVNAIINATPDHWHALGTVLACQAGKDVYVEKPTSHNIWESRKMVEAARKYARVVQAGTQNRSGAYCQKAFDYIQSGELGEVHFVRVLNSKVRSPIGRKPDSEPPEGVDYDMWLGPAPARPFNENRFHYSWHWFWDFSGGDIINDGVHQIDIARWMIDRQYPKSVTSAGGIHFFKDDQETPDTHTVNWDYDGLTMVFEQTLWTPYLKKTDVPARDEDGIPNWPFNGTRIEIYGSKQFMFLGRHSDGWQVFDANEEPVLAETGQFMAMQLAHIADFISCIRSRELPRADIEQVHYSTLLCHYGNIAYRTGRRLHIDPATEGFIGDDEANALVKRVYREPWVVPDQV